MPWRSIRRGRCEHPDTNRRDTKGPGATAPAVTPNHRAGQRATQEEKCSAPERLPNRVEYIDEVVLAAHVAHQGDPRERLHLRLRNSVNPPQPGVVAEFGPRGLGVLLLLVLHQIRGLRIGEEE